MNIDHQRLTLGLAGFFLICLAAQVAPSLAPFAGRSAVPGPCSSPEFHQFDFWLGDWEAFDVADNAKDSRVRVTRILDGCVVHEDYQSVDGQRGESFSIFDASRDVWHQTWVTNRGRLLVIEGRFEDGAMILRGVDRTTAGAERNVRGIWKPVEGGVRETAFTSLDGGKTWQPWFDLMFRAHK